MIKRDHYLQQLIRFKDKPLIKVITGIRRCGKSTLLALFENYLMGEGVLQEQIIGMNFESFEFNEIQDYKAFYQYIQQRIINRKERYYLLLDEVQQVPSWEKVVNALMVDAQVDIYITGSNAYLLSSELSTLLSGRYVEINMQPLSFIEYLEFAEQKERKSIQEEFSTYLKYGGLPIVMELRDSQETVSPFLEGIVNTVLIKDIIERNGVRDAALLDAILRFLASNIGNMVSTKKISDYLNSNGRKTTSDTIDSYLRMLENAFIIYKASRFDLKGKMYLKTLEKYYMVDLGIRNHLMGFRNTDYGHALENLIFMELKRRGFEVAIGKIGSFEVDFIATREDEIAYYQVSATIMEEATRERELRPFRAISDNYPKYILTMDQTPFTDYEGVQVKNIVDFLLESEA